MTFRPTDEAARERTRSDFGTSLVLEAGAGTGKTTLLVDRIEALVRSGTARLDQIAAVTFSENAAITMKLRVRERLEEARADVRAPAIERERASNALRPPAGTAPRVRSSARLQGRGRGRGGHALCRGLG